MDQSTPYREPAELPGQPTIKIGQIWSGPKGRFLIEDRRRNAKDDRCWGVRWLSGDGRYWVDYDFVYRHHCELVSPHGSVVRKIEFVRDSRRVLLGLARIAFLGCLVWFVCDGLFQIGTWLCDHAYHLERAYPARPWNEGTNWLRAWLVGAGSLAAPVAVFLFAKLCCQIGTPSR